ncbi:MAG: BRO family protein [Bacteroidales bacterium]|jgi:prophage antirepressor-like protein|nr:BRO family protein [Bacteroidales bacterium]
MIREFKNADYGVVNATTIDEQPYFCLVDIARILDIKNAKDCRTGIPSSDVETLEVKTGSTTSKRIFINAKHISTCLFKSKNAKAQQINDWLYRIVIPQLMKQFDYDLESFNDPETVIQFLDEFQDLKIRNVILETDKKLNAPRLNLINKLLGSKSCVDLDRVTQVIRFHHLSNTDLYKILRSSHVLDDNNVPYQEFCDRKYFRVVESKVVSGGEIIRQQRTYVYKSGVSFIEKILTEYEVRNHDPNKRKALYDS